MKTRRLSILLIFMLVAVLFCGCGDSSSFPEGEDYSQAELLLGAVNRFAGVVTTSGETKVEKDESKTVASISVAAGDSVKQGEVLFTYDGSQAQNEYDKAVIELQQLQITLESYNAQKAQLEAEKAAAPAEEQLAYTVQIQEVDTTIRETSYSISQKEKEVADLQNGLGQLEVLSPADGKVQSINTEGGTDQNGNPLPFIVLAKTNVYRVKAMINETNISDLAAGDEVLVRSRINDQTWTGKISSIDYDNPVQSSSSYDGTASESTSSKYPVYVELDNSEGLMLGQHVFIEKEITEPATNESPEMEGTDNMEMPDGEEVPGGQPAPVAEEIPANVQNEVTP